MASTAIGVREARPAHFLGSTTGLKIVMGSTGVILLAFVVGHMVGNLQFFEGPEKINAYGRLLRVEPVLLWGVRLGLLASVCLHIYAAVALARRNMSARPAGYAKKKNITSSYASRTMYWSGPIVLAFLIYHLLHLTLGAVEPGGQFVEGDVYGNMFKGFSVWWVSAWYIFSMLLLGLHIRHGAWSMFQTLGFYHPRYTPILKKFAALLALVIVGGFISIPIAVLTGLVK